MYAHIHHETHVLQQHTNTTNNNTSETTINEHALGVVADYISVSEKQDSISSLMTETVPLTLYMPKLFRCKKFITNDEELHWKGKIANFFYDKYNVPENLQQEWWAGVSSTVWKSLDNKRSTVAMAIKT